MNKNQKIWRSLFLCLLFCSGFSAAFLSVFSAMGFAGTVRVGYFLFDGYHMIDSHGCKSGYGYEYLQQLRKYAGWKYSYVGDDESFYWADMFDLLDNGSIDLLTSVSKTEERMEKYDFSEHPIGVKSTILTVKAGNTRYGVGGYDEWSGMKVGMLNGNSQNDKFAEFAEEQGFSYIPVYFDSSMEQMENLQSGSVDAIISSDLRSIKNEWILASFDPMPYYIVVKKGNALMEEVNAALDQLQAARPSLTEELHEKYYTPDSGGQIFFTAEEQAYIEKHHPDNPLRAVMNPDNPPYSYMEHGVPKGNLADIARTAFFRSGLAVDIILPSDSEQYWDLVRSGGADIILDAFFDYNSAEKYGYLLCDPYYQLTLSSLFLTKKVMPREPKVAMVQDDGFLATVVLAGTLKNSSIVYFSSIAGCVDAVAKGQVDQAVLYTNCAQRIVYEDVTKRFSSVKYPLLSVNIALSANEKQGRLLSSVLNKATRSLSADDINRISLPYSTLKEKKFSLVGFIYENPVWFTLTMLSFFIILGMSLVIAYVVRNKKRIHYLNMELQDALRGAQKANSSKSQFLAQVSHEIRTPMNAIIGLTSIAKTEIQNPGKISEYLSKIEGSSRLLLGIINDVLDMSAIEGGKIKLDSASFDFKKLTATITGIFYQQAKLKNITFNVRLHGVLEEVLLGDELRVNQILMNLLSNAVKFTPANGRISLTITQSSVQPSMQPSMKSLQEAERAQPGVQPSVKSLQEGERAQPSVQPSTQSGTQSSMSHSVQMRFSVADSGCGMGPDMLKRLFKPFEQETAATARKHGGSGLGLSITKRLVELMKGTIRVESQPGQGTTFTVNIPFGVCEQASQSSTFPDIRTLVVDNDKESCQYCGVLLDRLGIRYDCSTEGEKALEMLGEAEEKEDPYTLCIIDWQMPHMDGIEVTRQIRHIFGEQAIIIIVSGFDLNEVEAEGKAAGANYFIPKPLFQSTVFDVLMKVSHGAWEPHVTHEQIGRNDFSGKKVLVAEDVALNMEVAIKLLQLVGIEVSCAEDGQQAVDMYEKAPNRTYDCILLDINMPVLDGYDAARKIRASRKPDAKTVPIFAMTANAFTEDVSAALDAGMNGHIAKPIETEVLYATLEKAFQGDSNE